MDNGKKRIIPDAADGSAIFLIPLIFDIDVRMPIRDQPGTYKLTIKVPGCSRNTK